MIDIKEILKSAISKANRYGNSNLDFNVKLDGFEGDVAVVSCWNDGDEQEYYDYAKIHFAGLSPGNKCFLLEVELEDGNHTVSASGRALCALLYA